MKTKPIHGKPVPQNVPQDMQEYPPIPCEFKAGDVVAYTNGNGLTARARVRGFTKEPHGFGRCVYLEHWKGTHWGLGAWWFAESLSSIAKA